MKLGVWIPQHYETSVKIYTDNICKHLVHLNVELFYFDKTMPVPDVDVIWDPTCTGAQYPNRKIITSRIPWVVTLHGAANISMPLHYTFPDFKSRFFGFFTNLKRRIMWGLYKFKVAHIITVSKYAKEEIVEELNIYPNIISYIYHGYDDVLFQPQSGGKDFYLHVSVYQPKKNVERVIQAFRKVKNQTQLPLLVVCPDYPQAQNEDKITFITQKQAPKEIAKFMKNAYAFIFPSLHESFGMPLVEAMACGTPLITSNTTACPEIVKDAGITLNPEDEQAIANAIVQMENSETHERLSKAALARAQDFSWEKSALLHLEIFKRVIYNE